MSYEANTWWASPTAPVMWWAWTTTVSGVWTNTATLQWTYTSDWGSAVTATWFVVYPTWTTPYTIGSPFVMQYVDGTLPSPINATPTDLAPTTDYCARPYATNAIWTTYWTEICFTTNPVWYVTNLSSNNISIIDLTTFTNVWAISWVSAPLTWLIDDWYMYVWGGSNFISRVYLWNNTVTSLNLWSQVGAVASDATYLYVITGATNTLHRIDKSTFTVTSTLTWLTDVQSWVIVWTDLYLTLQASWSIAKVDLTTFTTTSTIATGWSWSHRVTSDWTSLYVTNYISNTVVRINIGTFTVTWTLSGGWISTPYWITYDPVTANLYVANNGAWTIWVINVWTFTVTGNIAVWSWPRYPLVKSWFLYIPCDSSNNVHKINLGTLTNVWSVAAWTFPCQFMVQQ